MYINQLIDITFHGKKKEETFYFFDNDDVKFRKYYTEASIQHTQK